MFMSNYSINILPKQSKCCVAYCKSENFNLLTFPPFSLPNPTGKSSLNELFHCWTNEALKEFKFQVNLTVSVNRNIITCLILV